jgi:voltage-dependent calcium channel
MNLLRELVAAARADADALNVDEDAFERRAQKADFIRSHPSFDYTFWMFSQKNFIRQFCQKLVRPPNGERIFGTPTSPTLAPVFQLILLLTVVGGIVVESIATPTFRNEYFSKWGLFRGAWFDIAECAFGLVLIIEFIIKVIADGFIFTPNAYVRSIWNIIDFLILAGILVNVTTTLIFLGGLSRLTRSLKALRALRLITLIDIMRNTFQSLIISGASRILDAALLAILYMIPYAVWGLNIFQGLMKTCTDGNVDGLSTCVNEYVNTANGGNTPNTNSATAFGYLIPRVWDDPAPSTRFSFDTFRDSLLILFEIVSLEGWIDVMSFAMSITGHDQQPQTNANQVNALFFVIYNLMGGVVILTIFVRCASSFFIYHVEFELL